MNELTPRPMTRSAARRMRLAALAVLLAVYPLALYAMHTATLSAAEAAQLGAAAILCAFCSGAWFVIEVSMRLAPHVVMVSE